MPQTGYTPIQLYRTATASAAPTAGNLTDGELALNTNDGKLFFKNSSGVVTVLADVTPAPGGVSYVAKTANFTVSNLQGVLANTSGGAFTVTLPASPTLGDQVIIADAGGAFGTNNCIAGRNGSTIEGASSDLNLNIDGVSVQFVYSGTTWEVYAQVGGNGGDAVTLTGTQTLTNKTLTAPVLTAPVLGTPASGTLTNTTGLPLTTGVTGTLPVANGGTGATSLTANNVVLGNGTSAVQVVAPSTSGNVLTSNGTTWASTTPVSSAGLVHISTVSASGASTASVTGMSSTYDRYIIKGDNVLFSANCSLNVTINGYTSSNYRRLQYGLWVGRTSIYITESGSANNLTIMSNVASTSTDANNVLSFSIETGSANDTGYQHLVCTAVQSRDTSGDEGVRRLDSALSLAGQVATMTSVQIYPTSGTFTGKFRLYGVSKAND